MSGCNSCIFTYNVQCGKIGVLYFSELCMMRAPPWCKILKLFSMRFVTKCVNVESINLCEALKWWGLETMVGK